MAICGGAEDIYGRLGTTKAVTPRKEGLELGGEMRSGKTKQGFCYFLILGKETSSREKGKEAQVEMGNEVF